MPDPVLGFSDWPTVEHFYQAQKFIGAIDPSPIGLIRQAASPKEAAAIGRSPTYALRPDWDEAKQAVMYAAVWQKFQTHLDIQAVLLATDEAEIIEDSPRDAYWGCGPDRQGLNHLGKILMAVRSRLRRERAIA